MDFIYLNNACPKDNFPFPRIDQLLLTFMDAFSSYNQILMKEEDQEKLHSSLARAYIATKSCYSD